MTLGASVAGAIQAGRPVVALESTIFSELGLPAPHNRSALDRSRAAVRAVGAEPAVTAVIDGAAVVGGRRDGGPPHLRTGPEGGRA